MSSTFQRGIERRPAPFNLEKLAKRLDGTRYDPEIFPGIAYKSPRASFLIFASGKVDALEDPELARKLVRAQLGAHASGARAVSTKLGARQAKSR